MPISTAATWSDSAPSRRLFCNSPVRRKRSDTSCSAFRCRDGVRRRSKQKRHRLSVVPLERATRISPKRRLRRIQRGEIEEAAGELPATAGKATIAATVSADGARKMKWSGRRGSNSLPPPWQGGALPDELRPRNDAYYSRPFLICQVKKRFLANKSPKCTQPFSVRAV